MIANIVTGVVAWFVLVAIAAVLIAYLLGWFKH